MACLRQSGCQQQTAAYGNSLPGIGVEHVEPQVDLLGLFLLQVRRSKIFLIEIEPQIVWAHLRDNAAVPFLLFRRLRMDENRPGTYGVWTIG